MSFCICRLMPKPKPKLVIVACVLTTILVFQKYSPDQPDAVIQEAMVGGAEISRLSRNLQPDKLNLENKDIKKNIKVDVPYPHNNLHPEDLTLIDLHPFTMEINQDICNVSSIALVTIVHSAVQNDHARKVIRETWGNPTIPGVNTRLVFLVGQSGEPDKEIALKSEAYQFNDIVQGDFLDTYHNLSYKNIFGKLWVSEFCEQAEFIVKTDDDMFIDLYGVYHITRQYLTQQKYLQDEFIFCPTHDGMGIIRDPASKWYASYEDVSKEEAPGNIYPAYCTGWIYILNPGTAKKLAEVAQTTKFFWIDDAWVTGILAKKNSALSMCASMSTLLCSMRRFYSQRVYKTRRYTTRTFLPPTTHKTTSLPIPCISMRSGATGTSATTISISPRKPSPTQILLWTS